MSLTWNKTNGVWVNFGTPAPLDNLSPASFCSWFRLDASVAKDFFGIIFGRRNSGTNAFKAAFVHFVGTPGATFRFEWQRSYDGAANLDATTADNTFRADVWFFIACIDGGAGVAPRILVGELDVLCSEVSYSVGVTAPSGGSSPVDDSAVDLFVGNREISGGTSPFDGDIAWTGIYNVALTDAQCQTLQFNTNAFKENCVHNVHHGYNGLSTQTDWSGVGANGTITGTLVVGDHVPLGPQWGVNQNRTAVSAVGNDQSKTPTIAAATFSAVPPIVTIERLVTPVAATFSSITPKITLKRLVPSVAATFSAITPTIALERLVTPVAATFAAVTPKVSIERVVIATAATFTVVTPVVQRSYNVTPVVATFIAVAPKVAIERLVSPVVATFAAVTPTVSGGAPAAARISYPPLLKYPGKGMNR